MGPVDIAAQIIQGLCPNVPPHWWPRVRELISEQDEKRYWQRLRANYRRARRT